MTRARVPFFFGNQLVAYAQTIYNKGAPASASQNGNPIRIYDRSSGNFKAIGWSVPILFFPMGRFPDINNDITPPIRTVALILDSEVLG